MKFILISDFFLEDLPNGGGAEYNDKILYETLLELGNSVTRLRSRDVSLDLISNVKKETKVIVSNFISLDMEVRKYLQKKLDYIIYEHDHKYLRRRNPALFKHYKAPASEIVNVDFYRCAKKVIAQTNFHKKIIDINIKTENVESLSGNLWSAADLAQIKKYSKNKKKGACSILRTGIKNKGMDRAIAYCRHKDIKYELISDKDYHSFLEKISKNEKLIFLPTTPETFSRICVEARMLGCKIITNELIGAKYEDWFSLEADKIIEEMNKARERIASLVVQSLT